MALTLQSMRVGVFGWRGEEEKGGGGGVVWVWEKEQGQTRPNVLLEVLVVEEKSVWRRGRQEQWWMTAMI